MASCNLLPTDFWKKAVQVGFVATQSFMGRIKHLMDANAVNGYLAGVDTDWWDMGTNDHPYIQIHNISVRGRSELNNYYMSVG